MRRMRHAVRLTADMLESYAYRHVIDRRTGSADEALADDNAPYAWIRQTVGASRHVSGTCRIGPDGDLMAVTESAVPRTRRAGPVGRRLVHHAPSPRANTNATAIMIGGRVADWIAGS